MLRRVTAFLATAHALATIKMDADVNQLRTADADSSDLKNCTRNQILDIQMDMAALQNCAENKYCNGGADDGRRRLQEDDEMSYYDKFACYCKKCSKYLETLQAACNSCDAPNYDDPCAEGNENNGGEDCEGAEEFTYQDYCVVEGYMVAAHQDTFCNMVSESKSCLTEMEYMINPPREEEEDDEDNRRRLADEDEDGMVDAEDIIACWASALQGGETYGSLTGCAATCTQYGNGTYSYLYDGQENPVQHCGIALAEIDLGSSTTDLLPNPVQHEGIACVSSSCTDEDAANIMQYVNLMGAYSTFITIGEQEGEDNRDEEGMNLDVEIGIPSTQVSWKCTGDAGEGVIQTDDFPEDEQEECESQEESDWLDSHGNEAKWATAATFAIVFALGMGVFACLYLHYYRQLMALKKAGAGQPLVGNNQAPAQAAVGYQGVTA